MKTTTNINTGINKTDVRTARAVIVLAEKASDQASADLLTQRIQLHEKTAWMLRGLLEEEKS